MQKPAAIDVHFHAARALHRYERGLDMFYRASLGPLAQLEMFSYSLDTPLSIHERIVVRSAAVTDAPKGGMCCG